MSLRAIANTPTISRQGLTCSTCQMINEMPEDEAAALVEMFGNRRWTLEAIREALIAEGYEPPGPSALGRHRRGGCLGR